MAYMISLYVWGLALIEPGFRADLVHVLTIRTGEDIVEQVAGYVMIWSVVLGFFLAAAGIALRPLSRGLGRRADRSMDVTVIAIANIVSGLVLAFREFKLAEGWWFVLPLLNAYLVLAQARPTDERDPEADMDAGRMRFGHAAIGALLVAAMLGFYHASFRPGWAMSISLACVAAAVAAKILAALAPLARDERSAGEAGKD
jgi:hypothetical protein